MKAISTQALLLAALLTLVGCGNKQSNVTMKVSAGFALSAAGYTGGLIAYGENTKGARFSVSTAGGQTVTTNIEDGAWKIYVVGWEETNGLKFRGTKYCGMTAVNLASSDVDINVNVTTANCGLAEFQADAGIQDLLISSCGGFYNYNSATNTYSPLTAAATDLFCSALPNSLTQSHAYYKLVNVNIQGPTQSPGTSTECISTSTAGGAVRLSVPTKKLPWAVQMYRSLSECQNPVSTAYEKFVFPNGINVGNQPSFDHHFAIQTNPNAHLFLPSSITRRGYSPFMNVQPRILCGGQDCFEAPAVPNLVIFPSSKVQWDVKWYNDSHHDNYTPTLIKGFKPISAPAVCDATTLSFLNSSPYFSTNNCRIEDGNLKASFNRNAFTCRGNADMGGMIDLYEKDGKIFLMNRYIDGVTKFKVLIYSKAGVLLDEVKIPDIGSQNYKSMTVDPSGSIYVLMDTLSPTRTLHEFTLDPADNEYNNPTSWTSSTYSHLSAAEKIEAVANATLVSATNTDIQAFTIANIATPGVLTAVPTATTIQKLLFKDGYLHVLSHYTSTSQLHYVTVADTSLTVSGLIPLPLEASSFHITAIGAQRYLFLNPMTASAAKVYQLNINNTLGTYEASYTSPSIGHSAIMIGSDIYAMAGSTVNIATFSSWKFTPGSPTLATAHYASLDLCEAQIMSMIDGVAQILNLATRNSDNVKQVFEEAFRSIGRRTINSPESFTYFESLQTDDHDDKGRSEGILNRASEMMGPNGLGGIINGLYPNQTCAQIKAAASTATGLNSNFALYDNIEGKTMSFAMNISVPTVAMDSLACPSPGCSTPYDLVMQISDPGKEKLKLKISCSNKLGSFESVDFKDSELRHELTIWNTDSGSTARFENYQIEDRVDGGVNKKRINISRLEKTAQWDLVHRSLELNRDPAYISGRVSETSVITGVPNKIMTSSLNTNSIAEGLFNLSNTDFVNGFQVQAILGNQVLNVNVTNAHKCMSTTTTDPTTASNNSCPNPPHLIDVSSKDASLSFNLYSLRLFTDGSTAATVPFYGIFTLQP